MEGNSPSTLVEGNRALATFSLGSSRRSGQKELFLREDGDLRFWVCAWSIPCGELLLHAAPSSATHYFLLKPMSIRGSLTPDRDGVQTEMVQKCVADLPVCSELSGK